MTSEAEVPYGRVESCGPSAPGHMAAELESELQRPLLDYKIIQGMGWMKSHGGMGKLGGD